MDERTQSEVEKILRKFEENKKERARVTEERDQENERIKREFTHLQTEVIRPVMEEVGSHVKKLGHDYHIMESEGMISLLIIPAGLERYDPNVPSISFSDKWPDMLIHISKRLPRSYSGFDHKVKVEEITKSFVEQSILELMKDWETKFSGK